MVKLCLTQYYFLYKNDIRSLPDSGPIGFSLMIVVNKSFNYCQSWSILTKNLQEIRR